MSYLVEAPRSLLITGWDAEALALGCGIAALVLVVALIGSTVRLSAEGRQGMSAPARSPSRWALPAEARESS